MNTKELWSEILQKLELILPNQQGQFKFFLSQLHCDFIHKDTNASGQLELQPIDRQDLIRLTAGNDFIAQCVREQFSSAIVSCAEDILGVKPKLEIISSKRTDKSDRPLPFDIKKAAGSIPSIAPGVLMADRQLELPIQMPRVQHNHSLPKHSWKYSFEDFVVGPCNKLAYAAASNIISASAPVDMVLLCAGSGLGKTHLTQAVGRALSLEADKRQVKMEYLTAEEFTSQFVQAMKYKSIEEFKERFRNLDMLLLEDVHFLRGKDKTQEELLNTIKNLQARGGRVVLTSSFIPRELAGLDSQLVSQFCSGFVASMSRPDRDMRLQILQEKARKQCMVLPSRVADLLADRVAGDVRILESCLNNLMLQSRFYGNEVTEEMAIDVIRNVACASPELSLEEVVALVCRSFDLTPKQLQSKSRRQNIFLLRKHTDLSLAQIGERFNRRHSTVIKGITSLEHEMSRHTSLGNQIESTVHMIERSALRQ